jgi:hypothetical protein
VDSQIPNNSTLRNRVTMARVKVLFSKIGHIRMLMGSMGIHSRTNNLHSSNNIIRKDDSYECEVKDN